MTASCSVSYTPTLTGTGVHTINGTYTPDPTHRRSSGTFALTVVDRPPVASFTESATQVPTGTTITFDARASTDPDGTIVSYAWNFGDGMTATGATTSHAYAKAGSYTVVLTVTDNSGSTNMASAMKTITDRAPTASFTFSPTSPTVGQTVAFDASSSFDPDGTITTYAWDFGDGVTGSGVTTTHAYSSTGTFTVTLIVTDDAGLTGTAQATITVQPTGAVCAGCHVSFFQWSLRTQWKKFSISQQGLLQNGADPIQAFAVNDGNQTVWSYVKFTVTGDSGVNQVLYTQIVQLTPGQQINGNQDPRFSANFVPTTPGTYFIQATVYFSNSSTQPPINDSTFTTSPPNNNATFSFIVRP